jgi:hypothetical protein
MYNRLHLLHCKPIVAYRSARTALPQTSEGKLGICQFSTKLFFTEFIEQT